MHQPVFDTLKLTQHLQQHGFAMNQSEGLVEAFGEVSSGVVEVIQADIRALDVKFSNKFLLVDQRLNKVDQRLDKVEQHMDGLEKKIDSLEHKVDVKFAEMDAKFDALEHRMDAKIDTLEYRMDLKIEKLDKKIDVKTAQIESAMVKWLVGTSVGLFGALGLLIYRLLLNFNPYVS